MSASETQVTVVRTDAALRGHRDLYVIYYGRRHAKLDVAASRLRLRVTTAGSAASGQIRQGARDDVAFVCLDSLGTGTARTLRHSRSNYAYIFVDEHVAAGCRPRG